VHTLALRVEPHDPGDQTASTSGGLVTISNNVARGYLLLPDPIDPAQAYPLVTVFHGAGRQDELLVRVYQEEPARRGALVFIPRSTYPTWDLLVGQDRPDLDFLEQAYAEIYQRVRVDPGRQALIGYSDGASYALSVGLSNPRLFSAVMGWAAGFVVFDKSGISPGDPRPRILLEHGTHDPVFPFEEVAMRNCTILRRLGYEVELRVDEGGVHWPSREFQGAALDWFFAGAGTAPASPGS
jgi:phospholipase/carboxylesterase